jgi:ABC-type dipeptide/oligopeptide/nickel transport system permease subunit
MGRLGKAVRRALARFVRTTPVGAASAVLLVAMSLTALLATQLAPFDPLETNYASTRRPPSAEHWLGTDHLGRDTLSRIIYGARVTLLVALASVVVGDTAGLLWGVLSGYLGGRFDLFSQRFLDILMSFPTLILAMLLMISLGQGLHTVIVAIAVTRVPIATRIIRSVVLSVKELPYVEAVRAEGASSWRIMQHHIAPQCMASFLVVVSAHLGIAIFTESALSFLGLGVPPPHPSWGNMLGGVLAESFKPPWWMVVFPGAAITLTILATDLFGDGFRDYLDPKLRGQL